MTLRNATALVALFLGLLVAPGAWADSLLITAQKLHIGNGTSIENGAVLVVDGRIVYAGPAAGAEAPNGTKTINVAEGSVTPGLVEANGRVESADLITPERRRAEAAGARPDRTAEEVVRDLFGANFVAKNRDSLEDRIAKGTIDADELDDILHGGKKGAELVPILDPADEDQSCCSICAGQLPSRAQLATGAFVSGVSDRPVTEQAAEIVPHTRVFDTIDLLSPDFQRLAREGVTTVYCSPDSSAVLGPQGAIVRTAGPMEERVIEEADAVKATIGSDPTFVGSYNRTPSRWSGVSAFTRRPTTRMGVTWVFRKAFHDSLLRKQGRPASGGADTPSEEASAKLIEVIDGKAPLRIQARALQDIQTAMRVADEFGLSFILEEATDAHRCLELLAERKMPVIYGPIYDVAGPSPRLYSGDTQNAKLNTLTRLYRSGIRAALSAQELREEDGLARQAMYARRYGLSLEDAIAAVTSVPAEILGLDSEIGTLETGKRADLVVWNGEPFAATSQPVVVIVGGDIVVDRRGS